MKLSISNFSPENYLNMDFDSFIVGPSNKNAHQKVLAIANGASFESPLIITSDTGNGKTHLLASLGKYLQKRLKTVVMLSVETMLTVSHPERLFVEADAVLLDSVEILACDCSGAGKTKFQRKTLDLLRAMLVEQKFVAMSCDPQFLDKPLIGELKDLLMRGTIARIENWN